MVAVGYAGGEEKVAVVETIRFKSSHEFAPTFSPVGIGTYTYTQFWEGDDEGLVISKSSADNTYRIGNWGGGTNFEFTWDPSTNQCKVAEQFTGYTHDSYGDVFVSDLPSYSDEVTYDDPETKTFTFILIYYVSAGYFGMGPETFNVEWNAPAAAPAMTVKPSYIYVPKVSTPVKMPKKMGKANFTKERRAY